MTEDPKTLDPAAPVVNVSEAWISANGAAPIPCVPKEVLDARTDEEKAKEDGPP